MTREAAAPDGRGPPDPSRGRDHGGARPGPRAGHGREAAPDPSAPPDTLPHLPTPYPGARPGPPGPDGPPGGGPASAGPASASHEAAQARAHAQALEPAAAAPRGRGGAGAGAAWAFGAARARATPARSDPRRRLRARAVWRALPGRVALVVAVACLPLLFIILFSERSVLSVLIGIAVAVGIAAFGIDRVVTRPLGALRAAVDRWRAGGTFELEPGAALPTELRGLGLSFRRAVSTLARRESQLAVAVERQELAMQEIHHRVKNNLQIVASLLNLQASRIRQPLAKAEFASARDRVRALATVHRHLYSHGDLHTINMRSFLLELCEQLFTAMGETPGERLRLQVEAPEIEMSSDQAVPLSLIVTEAVSNAIKYAYPGGRSGTISVRLAQTGPDIVLEIEDDGIGIPAGRAETEAGTRDGIGIQLINGFARQLGAGLEVEQGRGTRYRVALKLRRERPEGPALGPRAN